MNYKAVIFDMDGLLFDTEIVYYEASQMVADQMGFPYDKELYLKYLGVSDEEVWANYHQIFASFGKNNVQKFINDAYEETIRRFSLGAVQLKPGVIELLDFLEEHRIPKVVASSNQRHIIELLLEKNQLTNYFETIVSAENVKRAKPDPEIFLLAHEYLGTKKQETLVLEDSKNGILAAASADFMEKNLLDAVPATSLPRERMLLYGEKALSGQELLAILLRTGQHPYNVLELAGNLLKTFGGLALLRQATLSELEKIRGIGQVKALEIKALIELGKRIQTQHVAVQPTIHASYELAHQLIIELKDHKQEHLICIYLDTKNQVLLKKTLFIGSLDQTIAHPREVFHYAVRYSAARIILVHNHPSGNVLPSKQDLLFTKRVQKCGEMMGIDVLDHLIIGCKQYFSLREEGLMEEE